jgi:hypothetical protein
MHFDAPRAFSEFFLSSPCPLLLSLSNVPCPLSHAFVRCFPSYVSQFRPLSHCSAPCLSSFVPYVTDLLLVSRPLSPVSSICPLPTARCPQSYVSVPYIPSSIPCLTALLLVSHPLYPVYQLFGYPLAEHARKLVTGQQSI